MTQCEKCIKSGSKNQCEQFIQKPALIKANVERCRFYEKGIRNIAQDRLNSDEI